MYSSNTGIHPRQEHIPVHGFIFSFGLLPVFLPTGHTLELDCLDSFKVWPSRHQQFDLPFISVAFVLSSPFLVIFLFFSDSASLELVDSIAVCLKRLLRGFLSRQSLESLTGKGF